jgi:beta-N-acetylhexosaminidase
MRGRLHRSLLCFAALSVATAGLVPGMPASAQEQTQVPSRQLVEPIPSINEQISQMTLEQKVGQLFMAHAYGTELETDDPVMVAANQELYGVDNAKQLIERYHLGGIIYFGFSNNVDSPHQIATLSNDIQDTAISTSGVGALIAADQEQGLVMRTGAPTTQFPGAMALGATREPDFARRMYKVTGDEMRAMGINWNFAPVADVNSNPLNPVIATRAFGSKQELVSDFVTSSIEGLRESDVASAAKHFPGHGDADTDSHTGLPVINHTREYFEKVDLKPFRAAIEAGVDAIMTAHIVVPAFDDSGRPATLSKPILTGLLRQEYRYKGVIVTDALTMEGVRQMFSDEQIPVEALKAGADMMLMPPEIDASISGILDAVESGEISEARIDRSVRRILKLKRKLGLAVNPWVNVNKVYDRVGTPQNLATAAKVTRPSVTMLRNDASLLPLAAGTGQKMLVAGWGPTTLAATSLGVMNRGWTPEIMETGLNPDEVTIAAAVSAAQSKDVVLVNTNRAWINTQQQALVSALVDSGVPVIVLAVRDPYDATYVTGDTFLATYGFRGPSIEAALGVIFGELDATGQLPVDIPAPGDPTTIVYPYGFGL